MDEILQKLNITYDNPLEQRIPVVQLEKQLDADSKTKKLLESNIASMYLIGIINQNTTRIRSYINDTYNYQEILVLKVELKKENELNDLNQLIHSTFSNALIIHYQFKDNNYISLAKKRINKIEKNKTVIEDIIISKINDVEVYKPILINLKQISNLYDYYDSLNHCMYRIFVYNKTGILPRMNVNYSDWINNYNKINSNISNLEEQYKKANTKSKKISINNDLYDENARLKSLISFIKGGLE